GDGSSGADESAAVSWVAVVGATVAAELVAGAASSPASSSGHQTTAVVTTAASSTAAAAARPTARDLRDMGGTPRWTVVWGCGTARREPAERSPGRARPACYPVTGIGSGVTGA